MINSKLHHWLAAIAMIAASNLAWAENRILDATELRTTIEGNTLAGVTDSNAAWAEFYRNDGKVRGLWKNKDYYGGKWRLDGNVICVAYPNDPESNWCNTISVDGDAVTFHNRNSGNVVGQGATLLQGNAKDL